MARPAHIGWFYAGLLFVIALFLATLLGLYALAGITRIRLAAGESPPSLWLIAVIIFTSFAGLVRIHASTLAESYQSFLRASDRLRVYMEQLGPLRRHPVYFGIAATVASRYGPGAHIIWTYAITTISCVGLLFIAMFGTGDMLVDYATLSVCVCLLMGLGLVDRGHLYIYAAIPAFVAMILHLVIVHLRAPPDALDAAEVFVDAAEVIDPDHIV